MKILRKLIVVVAVFGAGLFLTLPATSFAGITTCTCWCGDTAEGATAGETDDSTTAACQSSCKSENKEFIICQATGDKSPAGNLKCYDQPSCINHGGKYQTDQPAECLKGFHYCENKDIPIKLGLAIGDVDTVVDMGEYIAVMYNWLIGAAAVFAIVMIIVGGIQYMVQSGAGDAKAAKDRIKNALIGFVLLMVSYLILNTVNPQTLKLQLPTLPMLRPVLLPDSNSTCLAFYENDYTIETANKKFAKKEAEGVSQIVSSSGLKCSAENKGTLIKGPGGDEMDGPVCWWTDCNLGFSCQINDQNDKATACKACADTARTSDDNLYPTASHSICNAMYFGDNIPDEGDRKSCVFSTNPTRVGYCVQVDLNCNNIKTCDDYNSVPIKSGLLGTTGTLKDDVGSLRQFCNAKDPCGKGPCLTQFTPGIIFGNCVNAQQGAAE